MILSATQLQAEEHYKSTIVITKLKKNSEGTALVPDLPFKAYSFIPSERVDLNDLKNEGLEIMAKVDFRIVDFKGIPNEIKEAEGFAGNMGRDFEKLKKDVRYTSRYSVTKAEKLATYTSVDSKDASESVKILYDGVDKDEVTKFCEWEESVKEVGEEIIKEVVPKETIIEK